MTKEQMILASSLKALALEVEMLANKSPWTYHVSRHDVLGTMRINLNIVRKYLPEAEVLSK